MRLHLLYGQGRVFLLFLIKHVDVCRFLPCLLFEATLKCKFVYFSLAILDILLHVKNRREEEIRVLSESLVSVLLGEVGEQLLRESDVLLVEQVDVVRVFITEFECRLEECNVVL